jgi:hypothetical protein
MPMPNPAEATSAKERRAAQIRHRVAMLRERYADQWPTSGQRQRCGVCRQRATVALPMGLQSRYFDSVHDAIKSEWSDDLALSVTLRLWQTLWIAAMEAAGWVWVPFTQSWQCPACAHRDPTIPTDPQLRFW